MKYSIKFTLSLVFTLIFSFAAQAQNSEWIRVQSDNGEFSIEVPAEYNFFADKNGFSVSVANNDHQLKEMTMLRAFHEKTLLSFESYKASKKDLDALREKESRNGKTVEIKESDYKIKQVVFETKDSYTVKKYFNSKNYIYVLTASTRNGETRATKRFFDSMIFKPDVKVPESTLKAVSFSALKATPIEIETKPTKLPPPDNQSDQPTTFEKDENITKLIIALKPFPSFTESARMKQEQGKIRLRVTFSKEGWISKISLLQTLQEGLLRQAVFAAIRIKFLPQEKNNEPVTVTKTIEYTFSIY